MTALAMHIWLLQRALHGIAEISKCDKPVLASTQELRILSSWFALIPIQPSCEVFPLTWFLWANIHHVWHSSHLIAVIQKLHGYLSSLGHLCSQGVRLGQGDSFHPPGITL